MYNKRKQIISIFLGALCALTFFLFFGLAFGLALCNKGNEIPYWLGVVCVASGCLSMHYGNEKTT